MAPEACEAVGKLDVSSLVLVPPRKQKKAVQIVCDCFAPIGVDDEVRVGPGDAGGGGCPVAAPAATCAYYAAAEAKQQRWLYTYEEAPPALRYNKFIRTGYRAGLSYPQCLCSILWCHNETGNILTHLLPALAILCLMAYKLLAPWPHARLEYYHNLGSILLCFCLSAAYHTFMANHHTYHTWLKLDVCGILLVLMGGGHMVLWWGFACHPALRTAFALAYYTAGAACVYAAVAARSTWARAAPMLVLLLLRLATFGVRMAVSVHPTPALWHYLRMEVYSLLGGAINALRVPERWLQPADPAKPGPLDYWLNSHQIMHVLVALAMWHLHLGATQDYHTVMGLRQGTLHCSGGPAIS